jgi:hypothetical protein
VTAARLARTTEHRRQARSSRSIVPDISSQTSSRRSGHPRAHRAVSTTAGRPALTVPPCRQFVLRERLPRCDLRGGAHRVTFRFMPRSFVYGLIVSGIGLALLATAVLVRLR